MSALKKVTITGITGYLGSHIGLKFLQNGSFAVRGTVRSITNQKKLAPLQKGFGSHYEQLQLVEADLTNPSSIDEALKDSDYVIHTASPVTFGKPKDEYEELIKPALEGTLAVMEAAKKHKVQRVVYTSTSAAIRCKLPANMKERYTEEDFSDIDGCSPYEKSKLLAEQAAWDFVNKLPNDEKFELAVINPSLIMGPFLCGDSGFSSGGFIRSIMTGKQPMNPKMKIGVVDVREVA